jgi:4-amino-4-deoxy-L-arabinose transferase-like glycosyltransferase
LFWRLGYTGLLDPDEAHYAQLTREMVRARSWFIPLLDGSPFIDKPVLFHWLQALSVSLLGESELANRIPSALAALGLIAITWWVARQLFDGVAELAATMFATLPATFALASVGLFDMLFAAFLFGGIAFLLVSAVRGRERLQYTGYVLLTLAVMTKGPVALLLVLLLFAAAWCAGNEARAAIRRLHWGSGFAIVTLASLPWFVWMSGRFGDRFVRDYVLAGNVWYFTSPKAFSTRASDSTFYLRTFAGAFFPWSLIVVGGALDRIASWRKTRWSSQEVWLWLWIVLVVAFFSAARFKLDTYIFPAAPACAILAAVAWRRAAHDRSQRWTRAAAVVVAAILVAGGTIGAVALFQVDLGLDGWAVLLPGALAAGGGGLLLQMRRRQWSVPTTANVPVVTLLVAYAAVVLLGFPVLESSRPTRPLGRWIARHTAAGIPVGIYGLEDWRASIRYYTDHQVTRLENADAVRSFLEQAPTAKVLMLRDDYRAMRDAGLDIQEVAARRAIVGRRGKYIRRQIWGRLVVVTRSDYAASLARPEWDLQ